MAKAMKMLGLNMTDQEMVDIPNKIMRYKNSKSIHIYGFLVRNGYIFFPDFCQLVLERFREEEDEEEEFRRGMFKVVQIVFKICPCPDYTVDAVWN